MSSHYSLHYILRQYMTPAAGLNLQKTKDDVAVSIVELLACAQRRECRGIVINGVAVLSPGRMQFFTLFLSHPAPNNHSLSRTASCQQHGLYLL